MDPLLHSQVIRPKRSRSPYTTPVIALVVSLLFFTVSIVFAVNGKVSAEEGRISAEKWAAALHLNIEGATCIDGVLGTPDADCTATIRREGALEAIALDCTKNGCRLRKSIGIWPTTNSRASSTAASSATGAP